MFFLAHNPRLTRYLLGLLLFVLLIALLIGLAYSGALHSGMTLVHNELALAPNDYTYRCC